MHSRQHTSIKNQLTIKAIYFFDEHKVKGTYSKAHKYYASSLWIVDPNYKCLLN